MMMRRQNGAEVTLEIVTGIMVPKLGITSANNWAVSYVDTRFWLEYYLVSPKDFQGIVTSARFWGVMN